jgi:hypothetical protein
VQACQGNNDKRNSEALAISKDVQHIEVITPETNLLMSTVYGETSTRTHFIPALAKYLGRPSGKTSLHEMFTKAITECQLGQRPNRGCDIQKPLFIGSAKNIILPQPARK